MAVSDPKPSKAEQDALLDARADEMTEEAKGRLRE